MKDLKSVPIESLRIEERRVASVINKTSNYNLRRDCLKYLKRIRLELKRRRETA